MVEGVNGALAAGGCLVAPQPYVAEAGGSLHGQVTAETLVGGQLDEECAQRRLVRTRSQRHRARRYARLVLRGHRLACGEIHPPGLSRHWQEEEDDHLRHDAKEHDHRPEHRTFVHNLSPGTYTVESIYNQVLDESPAMEDLVEKDEEALRTLEEAFCHSVETLVQQGYLEYCGKNEQGEPLLRRTARTLLERRRERRDLT